MNETLQPIPGGIPEPTVNKSPNGEMKWFDIWKKILLHPTVDNFTEIAGQSDRKKNTYLLFVAAIVLMSGAVTLGAYLWVNILLPIYVQFMPEIAELLPSIPENFLFWLFPCYFLFMSCSQVIHVGIDYILGRIVGGTGTFKNTFFVYCSFFIPIISLSAVLMYIPILNIGASIVGVYMYYLWAVGFKAVQNISWGKAIVITVVLPIVIGLILYGITEYVWMQYYMENMMNMFLQSYPSRSY